MSLNSTKKGWHWIVVGLIVIGLIVQLISSPLSIIIPIVLIGVVYYLYKRPPSWLQRLAYRSCSKNFYAHKPTKKKQQYRFRVIDGKKKNVH